MATTLPLAERIAGLAWLGLGLQNLLADEGRFAALARQAYLASNWFTEDNVRLALEQAAAALTQERLLAWTKPYHLEPNVPKRVGLVLAGNLPLVGWADVLAVLVAGHRALIKPSGQDEVLLKAVLAELAMVAPELSAQAELVERLKEPDAVIATGGNNTARYFEAYFGRYPHIIRKNRNSVAVLTGHETDEEMAQLGADVFTYFGLGCRSVSCVLVPADYEVGRLAKAFLPFAHLVDHHKYAGNLDYHKAIFLMNLDKFYDLGVVLVREEDKLYSPLSVLNLVRYQSPADAAAWLEDRLADIQVVVGSAEIYRGALPLGSSQRPGLADYADGIDTLAWLDGLE